MTRPRANRNKALPPNLYERKGYFSWCDPRTGKEHGLGRDRADAISQAREANSYIAAEPRLVERINTGRTVSSLIPIYQEAIGKRHLATTTRYARKSHLKAIEREMGSVIIGPRQEDATVITYEASRMLKAYSEAGKQRTAKAIRSTLADLFAVAASEGWTAVNPILALKTGPVEVRRQRLTLETFKLVYEKAPEGWERRSMELALVTLQRREEVSPMAFKDIRDGFLHVEQRKTGMRLRIPLTLRLEALGWTLADIVARCRDTILSRHLVHHRVHQGQARPGDAVHPTTLTGMFSAARDRAGIEVEEDKTPPTFHELRSLGARLYVQQGYDPQALLGHKDAKTTAIYRDNRGAEWVTVAVGLTR